MIETDSFSMVFYLTIFFFNRHSIAKQQSREESMTTISCRSQS
jgi:hypothetical protein